MRGPVAMAAIRIFSHYPKGLPQKTFHQNSGAWNAEKYWSLDMQPCEQHCLTHTFPA